MKGVIFTLDAIVAVIAATLMITSSYFYLTNAQVSEWQVIDAANAATDSLAVLEINNDLESVILTGSASILETFLDEALSDRTCGRIRIFNSTKDSLYSITKTTCNISAADKLSSSIRTFIARDGIYYAKMEAWNE